MGPLRRALLPALLAGAVLAACDAPRVAEPVPTYDPANLTGGLVYRWELGRTVRVHAVTAGVADAAAFTDAVARGVAAWRTAPGFGEVVLETTGDPARAEVLVFAAGTPVPVQLPCQLPLVGAAGVTRFCAAGSTPDTALAFPLPGAAGVARAKILVRIDIDRAGGALAAVVAHELGHAIGIGGHSDDAGDLMFGAPTVTSPSAADVQALRAVLARVPDLRL